MYLLVCKGIVIFTSGEGGGRLKVGRSHGNISIKRRAIRKFSVHKGATAKIEQNTIKNQLYKFLKAIWDGS